MKIKTFYPKHNVLQQYVASYYILEHSGQDPPISYLTFPSVNSIVAAVQHAEHLLFKNSILTRSAETKPLASSLVCRFNEPICFEYQGNIKEICIYFKPLGLNAFLPKPLASYSHGPFDRFDPFADYAPEMQRILKIEDENELAAALETYWLAHCTGFTHPFLGEAIALIDADLKITTAELARHFKLSQKTLIAQFKKHLCKTPSEYKKIRRFRKAITAMKDGGEKTSLTELSHLIDFFDQSHMIGSFKSLTRLTPRRFFENLTTMGNSQVHWIFS